MDHPTVDVLDEDEILAIRRRLAVTPLARQAFGGEGPLYPDRLAGAVARQCAGYGTHMRYQQAEEVAAALFHGLCLGHAFENGNKRTALVAALVLLEKNGTLLVDTTEDELYDLATRTADHELTHDRPEEVDAIASWMRQRVRPRQRGQERLRFRDLRALLTELGCEFDAPKKNYIKIRRETPSGRLSVKTGYPNENFEVPYGDIRRIRRRLQLDESSGYDRAAFFDLNASVDGFVNRYRQLMNRLADV